MASADGIDSIEFESTVSHSQHQKNIDALSITRTSDDNEKDRLSSMDDKSGLHDGGRPPGHHRYAKTDKERKIGHRRVGEGGEVTYKKIQTSQIMGSIQLGIQHTVGSLASKPKRDLLMMDFWEIESISFPPEGSNLTPAHHYSEFRFKIYAPIAFRYFRDLFGIQPDDFMMSMCSSPLRELSNPGASGSIFYLTDDDEFIIKTVQHKEGEFLQKLLPGYYMNLNQNPRTLLPKFFGLYCFQCNSKNVRLVVMNNLLPSYVKMHLKYDLKGSTYKRKASKVERSKSSPTYKDLDFMEHHPNGIFLEADTYNALIKTIQRDCTVLESFKIMDYSLLVGVHNLDLAFKEKQEEKLSNIKPKSPKHEEFDLEDAPEADQYITQEEKERGGATALNRSRSINRQRLVAHSTAMESIQAESEPIDEEEDVPPGGIPARSEKGERLLLFIGIIDILQSYRLKKKLEHTLKSIIHDGDTVSVCRPSFYAQRFQTFMAKTVFKKIPSLDLPEIKGNHRKFRTLVSSYIALKHSPSKRKSLSRAAPQRSIEAESDTHPPAGSSSHHHHYHISNTSQKMEKTTVAPAAIALQSSTATATTPATSSLPTKQTSKAITINTANNVGINASAVKQKSAVTKTKVPPPVPPRGSPKIRKGSQQQTSGRIADENALGASSNRYMTTNTCSETSPLGRNRNLNLEKKTTTLRLEQPMPKFGERKSPSNVRDWLEVNNKFVAIQKTDEYHPPPPLKSLQITPIPMLPSSVLSDIREKRKEFHNRPMPPKSEYFKRQNSFLSQSGRRSSVGSIVHQFPPIAQVQVTRPVRKRDKRTKKEYLEYIDMAVGDDDTEDNIINSLHAFVEAKKEIELKMLSRQTNNKNDSNQKKTILITTTTPIIDKTHDLSNKNDRKQSVPSVILEGSCKTSMKSDTSTKTSGVSGIRSQKRVIMDKMSYMNCDSDDSIINSFSLKGEFI